MAKKPTQYVTVGSVGVISMVHSDGSETSLVARPIAAGPGSADFDQRFQS
jgi:hypothetical protein